MRSSKDLAKRLRFDRYPRPDFFRSRYFVAGAAAVLIGLGTWLGLSVTRGERLYLPGPVSPAHATFGERCDRCHSTFAAVPDDACLACHPARRHSGFEVRAANCIECHVEHRTGVFLDVNASACRGCHANLESTRAPEIALHVSTFADHPELSPRREGSRDSAALRFNHATHLTSEKVAAAARDTATPPLGCPSCHVVASGGGRMQPVMFEPHCQRCHRQSVQGPAFSIDIPHEEPTVVRAAVESQLLLAAADRPSEIFEGRQVPLPGVAERPPADASRTLAEYLTKWRARVDEELYRPFDDAEPLLDHNRYCYLCHESGPSAGDLPAIAPTDIPLRWLKRAEFSHRSHDLVQCIVCHTAAASKDTADVNLPGLALCKGCHVDDSPRSAGTACTLCHAYHDTTKDPALRAKAIAPLTLETLLGEGPP